MCFGGEKDLDVEEEKELSAVNLNRDEALVSHTMRG